jgi:hypothetical protein
MEIKPAKIIGITASTVPACLRRASRLVVVRYQRLSVAGDISIRIAEDGNGCLAKCFQVVKGACYFFFQYLTVTQTVQSVVMPGMGAVSNKAITGHFLKL